MVDFGIAWSDDDALRHGIDTREGVGLGTPGYMAPEAWRGTAHVDARADVFALGAILYEILSGKRPFKLGQSAFEIWECAQHGRFTPLDCMAPETPQRLVALIHAALAADREARPTDAEALLEIWADSGRMARLPDTESPETAFRAIAPEGEVALAFSDIEGSSSLWEQLGSAFQPCLAVHDGMIRAVARAEGGYEVKSEGDGFFHAFASAEAGLRFCLAAQLGLQTAA